MIEQRDRDGNLIKLEPHGCELIPPPSSDKHINRLHYEIKQLVDVVNEFSNRIYELEQSRTSESSNALEPSVEYPYRGAK